MKKTSFTLTELVTVMLVITIVITVSMPLTKKKFDKIDSAAYYMGYTMMKDISANAYPDIKDEIRPDVPCDIKINGRCVDTEKGAFSPTPLTKSECTNKRTKLGISFCTENYDYWARAVDECGGKEYLFSAADIASLINYLGVYPSDVLIEANTSGNYPADLSPLFNLGFTPFNNAVWIWANAEVTNKQTNVRSLRYNLTQLRLVNRVTSYAQGICFVKNESNLCEKIVETYNISESNCNASMSSVATAAATGDFSSLTPHIILSNGLKIYIANEMEPLSILSGAGVEEDDKSAFTIYIDVNGKSGKSELFNDVFPYYLLYSGKVVPGYDTVSRSGGNNNEHLSINVVYDDYTTDLRQIKLLMRNANFQSAACAIGIIKSPNYCQGKTQYEICKDKVHDCRMIINEPVKVF